MNGLLQVRAATGTIAIAKLPLCRLADNLGNVSAIAVRDVLFTRLAFLKRAQHQGCQIFPGAIYQHGEIYVSQITTKYTKLT
jgi:hypothetical protein